MEESKSFVISKYIIDNKIIYAMLDWKNQESCLFNIKLFEGNHCWSGTFPHELAEKYSEQVDEKLEEYKMNVITALRTADKSFTFHFSPNFEGSSPDNFSWKKKHEDGTVQVHGSVPVYQENIDSKDYLIEMLLEENKDLKLALEQSEMNTQMLKADLEQCKKDLENFMNAKMSLEKSIYGKFVSLLNSKKRRIQTLENNLKSMTYITENDLD